jgi:hypothetical protein
MATTASTTWYAPYHAPSLVCSSTKTELSRQKWTQFNKLKGRNTRKAPGYEIIKLNVAHSACETSQDAQKTSPS